MSSIYKIGIFGIGAVGGYLGAKLAAKYAGSSTIEIDFIARGENEKAIKENGLKLITKDGELVAHPSKITSNPSQLGTLDVLIYCVKNYDLENSMTSLKSCIGSDTIILPFLNGADVSQRIQKIFPQTTVAMGCTYIVSRLISPGIVKETGASVKFYFGNENGTNEKLKRLEEVFLAAEINTELSPDIKIKVWEKFIFLSPFATISSYYDLNIGQIISNETYKQELFGLVKEVCLIADKLKIGLPDNSVQKTMDRFLSLPAETNTSMHDDFKKGGKTEVESLTGYIVKQGSLYNVATPLYSRMYEKLKQHSGISTH